MKVIREHTLKGDEKQLLLKEWEVLFRRFLVGKNLKWTSEREVIFYHIFSRHRHFSVDDIAAELHQMGKKVSKTSVFRTVNLLVDAGLLKKIIYQGRTDYYDFDQGEHHDHLECITCGKIIEFNDSELERLKLKACKTRGFQHVDHLLRIRGYCKDCRS